MIYPFLGALSQSDSSLSDLPLSENIQPIRLQLEQFTRGQVVSACQIQGKLVKWPDINISLLIFVLQTSEHEWIKTSDVSCIQCMYPV